MEYGYFMLYLLQYSNIADINIIEVPCGRGGALLLRDVAGAVRGGARHCLGRRHTALDNNNPIYLMVRSEIQ